MDREVNTNTRQKQTFISLIILGVLAVIAGGVFWVQFDENPAVQPQTSVAAAGSPAATSPTASSAKSLIAFPSGQTPLSALETFDATSLSDKIDGKAELYLKAGFIRLDSQRFKDQSIADVWLEVFVYDMQSTQNAFSVFSIQRRTDARPVDIGQFAYQTQNGLFFVHGPFYVEIIASHVAASVSRPMVRFAEAFIAKHPIQSQAIAEKELFPEKGLVKNSISLLAADAFGYDRFDKVFTATYRLKDVELVAFVSRRTTPREAQALATGYLDFLTTFGGQSTDAGLEIKTAKMISILDTYEIVFSYGNYLAGVREAAEKQPARELAMQLFNRIKEASNESQPRS
jgi:hypothetical protein